MPARAAVEAAFTRKRAELEVRVDFPAEVLREAEAAAAHGPRGPAERSDLRDVPFVTIDPPGSRDLDQALCIQPDGGGFRLWYAIADVGAWVERGGAVEREAFQRGVTFYAPDLKARLYPPVLSEDAASLLPEVDRPAVVFAFELDERAEVRTLAITRSTVRSRAQLTYGQALERGSAAGGPGAEPWAGSLGELKRFGEARIARERERGGVSIPLLEQNVERSAAARLGYEVGYERPNAAEDWNAQVSLLTGHAAALRMLEARVGMLRTMPEAEPERFDDLRRAAAAVGLPWAEDQGYGEFIRSLPADDPRGLALLWQARRVGGASDYVAFSGSLPGETRHAALAMPYAHVTAPLRRLGDRYVLDLLVQLERGSRPSAAEVETLLALPAVMNEADGRSGKLERAVVDIAEAFALSSRVGERFTGTVLGVRGGRVELQIEAPAVRVEAEREGSRYLELGTRAAVRLQSVSLEEGRMEFVLE